MKRSNRKIVNLTGYNVLVEEIQPEEKSQAGIIIPESCAKKHNTLKCGKVIKTGPGFLIPSHVDNDNDLGSINLYGKNKMKAQFIPLDIHEGDIIYYDNGVSKQLMLNGKIYMIVSYNNINVFIRDNKGGLRLQSAKTY